MPLPRLFTFIPQPNQSSQDFVEGQTSDLLFANMKEAYSSIAPPPLLEDQTIIWSILCCLKPVVQWQPVTTWTDWLQETNEAFQGGTTDWDVFCLAHGEDADDIISCTTRYINLCVDSVVPTETVHCFTNHKPWVFRDIQVLVNGGETERQRGSKTGSWRTEVEDPAGQGQLQGEAGTMWWMWGTPVVGQCNKQASPEFPQWWGQHLKHQPP